MECGGFGRTGSNHDGVIEGAFLAKHFHHVGHGSGLLAHGHVNAHHVLTFLVEDGVDCDSGFAGLTVANDQLPLATADGDHGVDRGDARLHGLVHRLALDDARRHRLNQPGFGGGDVALAIDGLAQGVHHAAKHGVAYGHSGNLAGGLHGAAFLNPATFAHQHHADVVVFEVQGNAFGAVFELNQLAGHHLLEAVDPGNAITDLEHSSDIADRNRLVVVLNLLLEDGADLVGADGNHGRKSPQAGRMRGKAGKRRWLKRNCQRQAGRLEVG